MKIGRMVGPAVATHAALKTAVHGVEDDYLAKTSQEDQSISDAEIPDTIARDLEVVNAIAFHADIATAHQNAPALINTHSGADDPHGDRAYTDTEIAAIPAALTLCDTEVYNAAAPNPAAWTDLDLSAVVGANKAIAWLRCTLYAINTDIAFRPDGETEFVDTDNLTSPSNSKSTAGLVVIVICPTSAAGVVEWKHPIADETVIIDVIAYIK